MHVSCCTSPGPRPWGGETAHLLGMVTRSSSLPLAGHRAVVNRAASMVASTVEAEDLSDMRPRKMDEPCFCYDRPGA
jgi:hypothetical protein